MKQIDVIFACSLTTSLSRVLAKVDLEVAAAVINKERSR